MMPAGCCGLPACVPPCPVIPTRSRLWRPPLAIILLPPCHNCVQPQLKVWLAVCRLGLRDSVVLHYLAPQPARNVSCLTTHLLPQVHCGGASQLLGAVHVLTACCESSAYDYIVQLQLLPQVRGGGGCRLLVVLHALTACCESPANDRIPQLQLLPQVLGGGACWLLVVLHVLTTCCESPANDYVPLLQVRGCCFAAAECHPYTHCRYQLWYWCSCARPCLLVPQRPLSHVCTCFGGVVVK